MMRPRTILLATPLLLATTPLLAGGTCESYGAGVDLESSTAATTILENPSDWDGETVRIEGEVRDVCRKAGCWMELVPTDAAGNAQPLKVKVEDGVIVFPVSSIGRTAVAQGTVQVRELDRQAWVDYQGHLAEEQNLEFDESQIGDGPFQHVQIHGTGAEVCAD